MNNRQGKKLFSLQPLHHSPLDTNSGQFLRTFFIGTRHESQTISKKTPERREKSYLIHRLSFRFYSMEENELNGEHKSGDSTMSSFGWRRRVVGSLEITELFTFRLKYIGNHSLNLSKIRFNFFFPFNSQCDFSRVFVCAILVDPKMSPSTFPANLPVSRSKPNLFKKICCCERAA